MKSLILFLLFVFGSFANASIIAPSNPQAVNPSTPFIQSVPSAQSLSGTGTIWAFCDVWALGTRIALPWVPATSSATVICGPIDTSGFSEIDAQSAGTGSWTGQLQWAGTNDPSGANFYNGMTAQYGAVSNDYGSIYFGLNGTHGQTSRWICSGYKYFQISSTVGSGTISLTGVWGVIGTPTALSTGGNAILASAGVYSWAGSPVCRYQNNNTGTAYNLGVTLASPLASTNNSTPPFNSIDLVPVTGGFYLD